MSPSIDATVIPSDSEPFFFGNKAYVLEENVIYVLDIHSEGLTVGNWRDVPPKKGYAKIDLQMRGYLVETIHDLDGKKFEKIKHKAKKVILLEEL